MPPATRAASVQSIQQGAAERLDRAFPAPGARIAWVPPGGFTGKLHAMDARDGGCRLSFTNLANGDRHSFGRKYVEMIPKAKPSTPGSFGDPILPGELGVTITFTQGSYGTELPVSERACRP